MPDYDTPETPPDTPPAIDPNVDPKPAAEMEAEGEREGPVLRGDAEDSEIAKERGEDDKQKPAAPPETILPPD